MVSLAQKIAKIEGWKYTSLFSAAHFSEPVEEQNNINAPQFDNIGDQLIVNHIVANAPDKQIYSLGASNTQDLTLKADRFCAGLHYSVTEIVVEAGEPATINEFLSLNNHMINALLIIKVKENASLSHYRMLDDKGLQSTIMAPVFVQVEKGARYTQILTGKGAKIARFTTQAELLDENAHVDLRGVHKLQGDAHTDHAIAMRHLASNCISNQSIRYIVDEESNGTFQGKIHVKNGAQKTQAYQLCKSLLLSDKGRINIIPELEIFADDVKCTHGATSGTLDQNMLFYLTSRGISKAEGERMLMEAFLKDVFDGLYVPPLVQEFVL